MTSTTPSTTGICVVGSINMDLVLRAPRMPGLGETITGHEFLQVAGGKGANQAVAAARQGAQVSMIACVGADPNGQQSLTGLQQDGIDISHISVIPDCASGVAGIFVDDAGNNSIVIAPGANARLTPSHIAAAETLIGQSRILICQCETPLETVQAAIQTAHRHGVKVVFNPAPARTLPDDLLSLVSHLVVNETEAGQLSNIPVSDIASASRAGKSLLERGVGCVVLTMGENGVCLCTADQVQHLPAHQVKAVDTTAAGDTFVGAFATALAGGASEVEAAMQAQWCAALSVTRLGAQSSIPYHDQVSAFQAGRSVFHP
jgi:ribokinase